MSVLTRKRATGKSHANESLTYVAGSTATSMAMLGFAWGNTLNGNATWAVVFAVLAVVNAAFAGANFVTWLVDKEEYQ